MWEPLRPITGISLPFISQWNVSVNSVWPNREDNEAWKKNCSNYIRRLFYTVSRACSKPMSRIVRFILYWWFLGSISVETGSIIDRSYCKQNHFHIRIEWRARIFCLFMEFWRTQQQMSLRRQELYVLRYVNQIVTFLRRAWVEINWQLTVNKEHYIESGTLSQPVLPAVKQEFPGKKCDTYSSPNISISTTGLANKV
jgi:hypothetical protein